MKSVNSVTGKKRERTDHEEELDIMIDEEVEYFPMEGVSCSEN